MYFTYKRNPAYLNQMQQLTFEDIFNNINIEAPEVPIPEHSERFYLTSTKVLEEPNTAERQRLWTKYKLGEALPRLKQSAEAIAVLLGDGIETHYSSFLIPKRSGGMRRIDAPDATLMETLSEVRETFEYKLHVLTHDAAFAYVKGRSTKECLMRHQDNESKWFLKLDIKDFFPSCNRNFITHQLEKIFPFNVLLKNPAGNTYLSTIISGCLLNNGLPQGTPISPMLTNLIMLPIDHKIKTTLKDFNREYFVYTRYADDMLISCKHNFRWETIQTEIIKIFQEENAPFRINTDKTRYGSANGRNWNLGLMLNKDNKITIGHQKKERFKAMLHNFFTDLTNGHYWSILDTQVMLGQISYYQKIEPEYVLDTIHKYERKFHKSLQTEAKRIINAPDLTDYLGI